MSLISFNIDLMRRAILKLLVLFVFAGIHHVDATAQREGIPGYIITLSHDTIYGTINSYRIDQCRFDDGSQVTVKKPGEIHGFRLNDGNFYVTKTVTFHGSERTIFVEYLLNGIASVYHFRHLGYEYYFIEKDGVLHELTNETLDVIFNGIVRPLDSNRFRGILVSLLSDCPEIIPEIERVTLSRRSLISVSRKYHQIVCTEYECIEYEKEFKKVKVWFGPAVSSGFSSYRFSEFHPRNHMSYLNRYHGTSLFTHGGGVNIRIDPGSNKRNSFFGLTSFLARESYLFTDTITLVIHTTYSVFQTQPIVFSQSVTYNFGPLNGRLGQYIGGGYSIDKYFYRSGATLNQYIIRDGVESLYTASSPQFIKAVHSFVLTGGLSIPTWNGSLLSADLSVRMKYGFSNTYFMKGWGMALSIKYLFNL